MIENNSDGYIISCRATPNADSLVVMMAKIRFMMELTTVLAMSMTMTRMSMASIRVKVNCRKSLLLLVLLRLLLPPLLLPLLLLLLLLYLPLTCCSLPGFVSPPMPARVRDDPHESPNE